MIFELTWQSASGIIATVGLTGKIIHGLVSTALEKRDDRAHNMEEALSEHKKDHVADVTSLRGTQKLLFDKLDAVTRELHEYKLHVAETYVGEASLEKLLAPIARRLETMEDELRRRP